jgi:uroporphyrinogen-III decarboxylase
MEDVYIWFIEHRQLMHRFLETTNEYVARVVSELVRGGIGPYFTVTAHEMLIPPWAGMKFFDEFVFPYDKHVNDVIRGNGGKLRIHCHGNAMKYLERFAEMGVDGIEPLEGPPMGDVDLAEAKRRVGDRMLLSGNVPSPYFPFWDRTQVEESVRDAIRAAAPGGGFTLRTTGATAGTNAFRSGEQLDRIIGNCEAYVLAGLEYGSYPIRA